MFAHEEIGWNATAVILMNFLLDTYYTMLHKLIGIVLIMLLFIFVIFLYNVQL